MPTVLNGFVIASLLISKTELGQIKPPIVPVEICIGQKPINTIVSVSLPLDATIWLRAGGSKSGQMKDFNSRKKVLTINETSIQLTEISTIKFSNTALVYTSDGVKKIRGEDEKGKPRLWPNIPLNAFQFQNSNLGQAQINLAGIMDSNRLRNIQSVIQKSIYVVNEIQFESTEKMTITVTRIDR
jgi:hypothetical protein